MRKPKIVINGKEFELGYKLLLSLAENFPSGEQYEQLGREILKMKIPSITCAMVRGGIMPKWHILSAEAYDRLWKACDREGRHKLLRYFHAPDLISDAQVIGIMERNDEKMLLSIAGMADRIAGWHWPRLSCRLSQPMAAKLLRCLALNENSRIRKRFFSRRSRLPRQVIPTFRECCEAGPCPGAMDYSTIRVEDLELVNSLPAEVLVELAANIQAVEDKRVMLEAGRLLAASPEPAARAELAANRETPEEILQLLCRDAFADIASLAANSLEVEKK